MEGYIIAFANDENSDLSQFWDGTGMSENIADSRLYPTRADAKLELGQIVSLYSDNELSVHPATRTVTITRTPVGTAPTRIQP